MCSGTKISRYSVMGLLSQSEKSNYKEAPLEILFLFILSTELVSCVLVSAFTIVADCWCTLKIMSLIFAASSASGPMKRRSRCRTSSLFRWKMKSLIWWIGRWNFNDRPPYREQSVNVVKAMAITIIVVMLGRNRCCDILINLLMFVFLNKFFF